jgi:ATP-dependent protease HslVU (ClpYQ) peptidase subunit
MSTFEFLVTMFVDRVRSCLRTGGFAKRKEEQELAGSFLLGYRGSLYSVDGDYQVARAADGISAVGCGAHIALGALHALNAIAPLNSDKLTPNKRLEIALDAAQRWNSAVRSPFVILSN